MAVGGSRWQEVTGGDRRWKEVEGNDQQVLVVGRKWPSGCHRISECCKMLSGGFKMWQKVVMRLWDVEGGCHVMPWRLS